MKTFLLLTCLAVSLLVGCRDEDQGHIALYAAMTRKIAQGQEITSKDLSGLGPLITRRDGHIMPDGTQVTDASLLDLCVLYNRIRVAETLLVSGFPIHETNSVGETALHLAATLSRMELVSLLVRRGAPLEQQTKTGATPLLLAIGHGSHETVLTLLDLGSNPSAEANDGTYPLFLALVRGTGLKHADLARLYQSSSPSDFHRPVAAAWVNVIETLVAKGAKPCYQSSKLHLSALHLVVAFDSRSLISFFLAHCSREEIAGMRTPDLTWWCKATRNDWAAKAVAHKLGKG